MRMMLAAVSALLSWGGLGAQTVDYSVVAVPEESGIDFMQVTTGSDYVCMPEIRRGEGSVEWLTNRILDVSPDGRCIAYLSYRNRTSNIFIKELGRQGNSVQRTNRAGVLDFAYSPDGRSICFSEMRGAACQIFLTDAANGYVCRQITSGSRDYSPVWSSDMKQLFFARREARGVGIWSYDTANNFLSSYSPGMNPCPVPGEEAFVCTRVDSEGRSEIWKISYRTGVEECIVSDPQRSFTTPAISPDGRWILFVGESVIEGAGFAYPNTDIYVCRTDGSSFAQITYHAADDLSPVWSRDGRYIYFVSQRGDAAAAANIWRMTFPY